MSNQQSVDQSDAAELAVLGALLIDNDQFDAVREVVGAGDFAHPFRRDVFKSIEMLLLNKSIADVVTVGERLLASGAHRQPMPLLGDMCRAAVSAANAVHYASIVRDYAVRRELIAATGRIVEIAQSDATAEVKLDRAQNYLSAIAERTCRAAQDGISAVMTRVIDRLDERFTSGTELSGLSTGFEYLDGLLSGLQPSDLIIVAGRPSMGKTTLAINFAEEVAVRSGKSAMVFSLEMSADQLATRMLASVGGIQFKRFRDAKFSDDDWPRITSAMGQLSASKLVIDDTPSISLSELRIRARRQQRAQGLDLIVVDYIQLMRGDGDNRSQEIGSISRGLKALAKELDIPVVALSQLNRGVDTRGDKRPLMSDLRESGEIEQDADVIIFVYRDEVYDKESRYKGTAEFIVGKQRNGELGTAYVASQLHHCRFRNLAPDYTQPEYEEKPKAVARRGFA